MNSRARRKSLPHDPPHFIGTSSAIFFLTLCCESRGRNQLCQARVAQTLFDAAQFYQARHEWYVHLLLLMPDHLHLLARFGPDPGMRKVVEKWKRYTATHAGVLWQRDFFDHRLRSDESFDEKAEYIRQNPARAGLVKDGGPWPFLWMSDPQEGTLQAEASQVGTSLRDVRDPGHSQSPGRPGGASLPDASLPDEP